MKKIASGSVKELFQKEGDGQHLYFKFSNRVSVFDYGPLPDEIPGRAESLFSFAQTLFEALEENSIPTAFVGLEEDCFKMRGAQHGHFPETKNYPLEFCPVEVIFRWGVLEGSSLLKRDPSLKAGEKFPEVLVEYTTKLEATDRLLSLEEASRLMGGVEKEKKLRAYTEKVALFLKNFFESKRLQLWDGKIECAWDPQKEEFLMVDALTPDELRLTLPGLTETPLSKELLRSWLATTEWSFDWKKNKDTGLKKESLRPPALGTWRRQKISSLYRALALQVQSEKSPELMHWFLKDEQRPKVFVLGQGGREAAEKWRLEKEGVELVEDPEKADCVWVSKDGDLEAAAVDKYQEKNFWTYGPRRAAAKLEWSKEFGREMAQNTELPQPRYSSKPEDLRSFSKPPVIKKDALAAGKGVVVPESWEEAEAALEEALKSGSVLLEERLEGPEASFFVAVQTGYYGVKVHALGSAQDYKRRFAGDEGPNTGGMGAFTPHPLLDRATQEMLLASCKKAAENLAERKIPYHGIIYMGLMKDVEKSWTLIEYNARFGDPETQALVMSWDDKNYLRSLLSLSVHPMPEFVEEKTQALCLALVRKEYPGKAPEKFELPSWSLEERSDLQRFDSGSLGGRVSYLVASAEDRTLASDKIFESLRSSPWKNLLEWRPDILA